MSAKEDLLNLLEAEGLQIAEDIAVKVVKAAFVILPEVAKLVHTPFEIDDVAVSVVKSVEPQILAMLDRIDGQDDPGY